MAFGYCRDSESITSSGYGSLAFGYTGSGSGDIIASNKNAVQFGPGTNNTAYSLQIGDVDSNNSGIQLFSSGRIDVKGMSSTTGEATHIVLEGNTLKTQEAGAGIVNSGTSPRLAYYSSANVIDDTTIDFTATSTIAPIADNSGAIGTTAKSFEKAYARKIFAIDGTKANATITADAGIVFGEVDGTSSISVGNGVTDTGAFAGGKATNGGTIITTQYAAIALGRVNYGSSVISTGVASFAQGQANQIEDTANSFSRIYAKGNGSLARGRNHNGNFGINNDYNQAQIYAQGSGSTAFGSAYQDGYDGHNNYVGIKALATGATAFGSISAMHGFGETSNYRNYIQASGIGSTASGYIRGDKTDGYIYAEDPGSFAQGSVLGSMILSTGNGSFAQGRTFCHNYNSGSSALIEATNSGSFAQGFSYTYNGGSPYNNLFSKISATGIGSSARGHAHVDGYQSYSNFARIEATDSGATAWGRSRSTGASTYASYSKILASQDGATAFGYALSNATFGYSYILASGKGSIACGYTKHETILANATGAFQLGPGTNNTANSLQVGTITGSGVMLTAGGNINATGNLEVGPDASLAATNNSFALGINTSGGLITASGKGSFAHGENLTGGQVAATGVGSHAHGRGYGGVIVAVGIGATAAGSCHGYSIFADGIGSFACGKADGGGITASVDGSAQFGPGSNGQTNSLQVGDTTNGVLLREDTVSITAQHYIDIDADNEGLRLGELQDAHIYYDDTDLVLDPALVGTGGVKILSPTAADYVKFYHNDSNVQISTNDGVFVFFTEEAADATTDLWVVGSNTTGTGQIHTERFVMTETDAGNSPADLAEMAYNEVSETIDFNFF
jgi:hypothetical protein